MKKLTFGQLERHLFAAADILRGKMDLDPETPTAEKMMFVGSVYDPHYHKWMHDVRLEMPAP